MHFSLSMAAIRSLHLVQNVAARVLTRSKKTDHVTPALMCLHWLPIEARADFKILPLTYEVLDVLAFMFSWWLFNCFQIRACLLWNELHMQIWKAASVEIFKSMFKTHPYCWGPSLYHFLGKHSADFYFHYLNCVCVSLHVKSHSCVSDVIFWPVKCALLFGWCAQPKCILAKPT